MLGGTPPDFAESLGVFLFKRNYIPLAWGNELPKLRLVLWFSPSAKGEGVFYADLELGSDAIYRSIDRWWAGVPELTTQQRIKSRFQRIRALVPGLVLPMDTLRNRVINAPTAEGRSRYTQLLADLATRY